MKTIILALAMFAVVISANSQVKDSINGQKIEGIWLNSIAETQEINGIETDYVVDVYSNGAFDNSGRMIVVFSQYKYVADDSSLVAVEKNIRVPVNATDSLIGYPASYWLGKCIDSTSVFNYHWMMYFSFKEN